MKAIFVEGVDMKYLRMSFYVLCKVGTIAININIKLI